MVKRTNYKDGELIQEPLGDYTKYITEATSENALAKLIERKFGVKIKKVEVKRKITFQLAKPLDERDFDNFDIIDGIHELLQKQFKNSTTEHEWDKFTVEEL